MPEKGKDTGNPVPVPHFEPEQPTFVAAKCMACGLDISDSFSKYNYDLGSAAEAFGKLHGIHAPNCQGTLSVYTF